MLYFYIVASAVITLFSGVTTQDGSLYKTPLLLIGCFIGFIALHAIVFFASTYICKNGSKFYRRVVKHTLPIIIKLLRVDVHINGEDKVPEGERFLLVCNHIHNIDPAIILYALPDAELSFIGKKEIKELMPMVFRIFSNLGGIPIDRENNREGAKAIIKACNLIKNDEASVGIFPEGYTSLDGNLQSIRNGALKIATKTGSKIVVCTLVGTKEAIDRIFIRRNHIYFDILEVIDTVDNTHTNELGDRVHALMAESIEKRRNEASNV